MRAHVWCVSLRVLSSPMATLQLANICAPHSFFVPPPPLVSFFSSDENFFLLGNGDLNAQTAFMSGKLKIKGNMGLAMKLGPIIEQARPKSHGGVAPSPVAGALKSTALFQALAAAVAADGPALVKKLKGVVLFDITDGEAWTVDLKNGAGSVTKGKAAGKIDLTMSIR